MEQFKIHQALLTILEAPNSKKGYALLVKCYEQMNREEEAKAVRTLIKHRFEENENNDSNNSREK